jgi:hypothetical protein
MTQTPFIDEEELKLLEQEYAAEEAAVKTTAPTPQTVHKEPTAEENTAAGNVQPVKSPEEQGRSQLGGITSKITDAVAGAVEGAAVVPLGMTDFGMDLIGRIPGAEHIDDAWDAKTKFKNPLLQKIREATSIVVPSIGVGVLSGGTGSAVAAGGIARAAAVLGVNVAGDLAINAVSDQSEGKTFSNFIKEVAPWAPVPEGLIVHDGDSPQVRRLKNMYESAGLSIVGDIVGFAVNGGRSIMDWFKPNDDVAKAFKSSEAVVNMDPATATRLSEIDSLKAEIDAQGFALSSAVPLAPEEALQQSIDLDALRKAYKGLEKESVDLTIEYLSTGASRVTENPFLSYLERQQISRDLQIDDVGKERLRLDPDGGADPFITPSIFPEGSSAAFSVSPGSAAKNMVDVTGIHLGNSIGSPAPILSERHFYDLSAGNATSRDIVFDLSEASRAAGDFDAVVNGFRYTKAQMVTASEDLYKQILNLDIPNSELKKIFMDDAAIKPLLDGRKVKYLNDYHAEAVSRAMKDLTARYLGPEVNQASARAMATAGHEISDIAEGFKALPETADAVRVKEMLGDRISFLMGEYGINKYIAGWSLKVQDRFKRIFQSASDKEAAIRQLMDDFDLKINEKMMQAQGYRNMLDTVLTEKPEAAQALIDAFSLSNGEVDTIDKLMKWTSKQMSPSGLIYSGEDGMNAFAKGAWAVRYGNMLSGLSALRAVVGNAVNLTLRPINSVLGSGIGMMIGRNSVDDVKRAMYGYSSMFTTHNRALGDAFNHFKKLHANGKWGDDLHLRPQLIARDDLVDEGSTSVMEVLDKMVPIWQKQGNTGQLFKYQVTKALHQLGNWNMLKYGTNALESADMYVRTTVATQAARFRAYDEVMSIGYKGQELANQLAKAEKLSYGEMFDNAGNITDKFLMHTTGEIALNLDDGLASFISSATSKLPILKPLFMFPKTGINGVKLAMSYTPLAAIPGMTKYGKVLSAGKDIDKIKDALLAHGIIFDQTPNAMAVFKGLEAEYTGRVAFGALLTTGLFGHAMAGNIRGNGPVNESERKKLRDNFGWKPKHINIGGKWVSYAGYEPLDTILSLVGDLAYYANDIGSTLVQDWQTKLAWSLSATFVNKTFTAGLEPLVAIVNGDQTATARFLANEARSVIPWSGALGVAADAISSSQKDIYNDLQGYVKNRLPGLNTTLPEQIDIYTGKPLNDIDNHFLRAINAVNPVKVSEGTEPWRQWLINTGWDGLQMIRKDSTGNHEYTPAEREVLYRYIGEQQIWKEYDRLRTNRKYNEQLDRIRAMRVQGRPTEEIDAAHSEVYSVLNDILRNAQKVAEQRLQAENQPMWRSIQESIRNKDYMKQGRIDDAARAADRRKAEIEQLLQSYK